MDGRRNHPLDADQLQLDADLLAALHFEVRTDPSEIDTFRGKVLAHWTRRAVELRQAHRDRVDQAPRATRA